MHTHSTRSFFMAVLLRQSVRAAEGFASLGERRVDDRYDLVHFPRVITSGGMKRMVLVPHDSSSRPL